MRCAQIGSANPLGNGRIVHPAEKVTNLPQRFGTALPNHPHRHVLCLHSSFAIKPLCRFTEHFAESSAISIIMEDSLMRVAPPAKMIDGMVKPYPQRPCHPCVIGGALAGVKYLDLAPSLPSLRTRSSRIFDLLPPRLIAKTLGSRTCP